MSVLVADGDSITSQNPYTSQIPSLLNQYWNIHNVAVSGETLATMLANAPTNVDPLFTAQTNDVVIIWGGTNDLVNYGTPVATVYSDLQSYCSGRRSAGFKVVVVTMLSRASGDSLHDSYNALIRAGWTGFADALCDVATNPNLGADGAYANTNYFIDGVHPTIFSINTIIAPLVASTVNSLYPLPSSGSMVQLESYGFTTVENPLSDGGNFTVIVGPNACEVPSLGICQATALNQLSTDFWTGNVGQVGGMWPTDQYSEMKLAGVSGGIIGGFDILYVRCSSVNTNYQLNCSATNATLFKNVSGTQTQIGNLTGHSYVNGDVIRLTANGSTLTVASNGSAILTVTDSSITSGGGPGFGLFDTSALTQAEISLWAGGGNQAATPTFSQTGTLVTISSTTSGGTIYYTTDGSTPTHSSSSITNGGSIIALNGTVINAFESATNFGDSALGTYTANSSSGGGGGTSNDPWMSPWVSNSLRGVRH